MQKISKVKEPSIIIKPIGRFGGLDNLHLTLMIVIGLLFLLLLVVSYSKPILITNQSNATSNCTGTMVNGTCVKPAHNATQIRLLAERVLASYANVNSSLSLLPYISNTSSMNLTFLPGSRSWYVRLNAKNFVSNVTFAVAFLVSDADTSNITPLLQTQKPSKITNNSVVSLGVVRLGGKYSCLTPTPTHIYWFIDPYAAGAVKSLLNATAIERKFGSNVNLTMKILFGVDTESVASSYGLLNAESLGRYVLCASQQKNFSNFAYALGSIYSGSYLSQNVLTNIANSSKLNYAQLTQCINVSGQDFGRFALLANYYNITQTPVTVVDCNYMALPQTTQLALCYDNKALC